MDFLKEVDKDVLQSMKGKRGRVSYPIIRHFLESGLQVAEVQVEKIYDKSLHSLYMALKSYLQSHPDYPVTVVIRKGKLFLVRVDK